MADLERRRSAFDAKDGAGLSTAEQRTALEQLQLLRKSVADKAWAALTAAVAVGIARRTP